ncbi:MAG: hypothetical protein ABI837_01835, partial [Acidobacteriota bacterium]
MKVKDSSFHVAASVSGTLARAWPATEGLRIRTPHQHSASLRVSLSPADAGARVLDLWSHAIVESRAFSPPQRGEEPALSE